MKLTENYPVSLVCQVLSLARSSYYYPAFPSEDESLRTELKRVAAEWPTYGYRRLTQQLKRAGIEVGETRIRRLMEDLHLFQPRKKNKKRTTNSDHPWPRYPNLVLALEVTHPDQVWVGDISYIRLASEFVYLAVLMDVFTRGIRGWHLGRQLDQSLTLTALDRALQQGIPTIHHSDQGVQYAATEYVSRLKLVGAQISMAEVGEAWQNGYAERLIRTIKEEEVDLSEYLDYHDAYHQIGHFLEDVYMHKRIHSSLGYLTPVEFEASWWAEREVIEFVH
jgi:transposase InsO family protein